MVPVVAVVVIVALVSDNGDPLSVKNTVLSGAEPSFVKAIVPSVIEPMLFVLVVYVDPLKVRFQVPDVDGADGFQLADVNQLPEPPPPVHVALVGSASDGRTPAQKALRLATAMTRSRR